MQCPHCETEVTELLRTGNHRYCCTNCNKVIAYDDVEPHLEDMEVDDGRDRVGKKNKDKNKQDNPSKQQQSMSSQPNQDMQEMDTSNTGMNEREIIYQRGTEGLKEIKKERLTNWLEHTKGVGDQTANRILMVFERNDSVHSNPNVLYNLLDDELSASPSYINTLVQDIFEPEREHEDILSGSGYTPWHRRAGGPGGNTRGNNMSNGMNGGGGMGGGFNPNRGGGMQQQYQPQQNGGMQQQQGRPEPPENPEDIEKMSKDEREEMVRDALDEGDRMPGDNPVRRGLSEATDKAIGNMADNVGGLAQTFQKVIDEALVSYFSDNPEVLVENMGLLQSILGASQDSDTSSGEEQDNTPAADRGIDNAISNIDANSQTEPQYKDDRDLPSEDEFDDYGDPSESEFNPMQAGPLDGDNNSKDPAPKPDNSEVDDYTMAEERRGNKRNNTESHDSKDAEKDETADEVFDDIFGDMAE